MYTGRYPLSYARGMTELEKGPQGLRRGRGARERILSASLRLFREQGINQTGMDQLCAEAQVSKRTAYQHFAGKDELVDEYLRRFDPGVMAAVFDRPDLTPRERLLPAFCPPPPPPQDANTPSRPSTCPRPRRRTTSRPCVPSSRRPSKSPIRTTPYGSAHTTTNWPSPRG